MAIRRRRGVLFSRGGGIISLWEVEEDEEEGGTRRPFTTLFWERKAFWNPCKVSWFPGEHVWNSKKAFPLKRGYKVFERLFNRLGAFESFKKRCFL